MKNKVHVLSIDCVEAYDPVNPYNLIDNFVDKGNSLSIGILKGPSPF